MTTMTVTISNEEITPWLAYYGNLQIPFGQVAEGIRVLRQLADALEAQQQDAKSWVK